MNTHSLFAATLLALFAAGCTAGTGSLDNPATDPVPGPTTAAVVVDIVGAGSVSYNDPGVQACAGSGGAKTNCPSVRFDGGSGTLTATAATGWRFDGWSLAYGDGSPNAIANPQSPTTTVLQGTSVALVATFVPLVHPIQATFSPEIFSTTYQIDIDNPDLDIIKVEWSGPNCGSFDPKEGLGSEKVTSFEMTWAHPHGPQYPNSCDATTNHADVTVTATVTIKDKTFTCTYQGAETGTGPACK
jgi:hypothetical protein